MLYMEILFLKTKRKNYLKGSKRMILKCENLKNRMEIFVQFVK